VPAGEEGHCWQHPRRDTALADQRKWKKFKQQHLKQLGQDPEGYNNRFNDLLKRKGFKAKAMTYGGRNRHNWVVYSWRKHMVTKYEASQVDSRFVEIRMGWYKKRQVDKEGNESTTSKYRDLSSAAALLYPCT